MSFNGWTAWELTRRISPRDRVQVMVRDAYGRLEDNAYPRVYRLQAAPPVTPWFVRLADDTGTFRLLCFDFDGKDAGGVNPDLMDRAADDCTALSTVLDSLKIRHVVCQSSGTGGRHIWAGIHGGASAAQVAALATAARANYPTLDHGMLCNPRTGGARPPLAPHRDGSSSSLLSGTLEDLLVPTTTAADLTALHDTLEASRPAPRAADTAPSGPVDASYRPRRPLSAWGAGHLATLGGGTNPSWTGFMCLLAAATAGWSLADVTREARTAPGMEHYRTKNTLHGTRKPRTRIDAVARLERQWAKARQYAALQAPLKPARTPLDLRELEGIVTAADTLLEQFRVSPGRWSRTEVATSQRSILTAIAYLSLQTGKRTVAASIRDLGLMVGLSRDTARRALHALAGDGFLHQVAPAEGGNAAEWCLADTLSTPLGTVASQPVNNPRPPGELFSLRTALVATFERQLTDGRHDLFTRAGIGHLAGKAYTLLADHPALTLDRAAQLLGVSTRHAATILSRLRHHRLIVRHKDGWARARRDLRDRAAQILGIAGTLADRAGRYQAERDVWSWWQAELATMTTFPTKRSRRPHATSRPLFHETASIGERTWPRYPRTNGLGDHRAARHLVDAGALNPDNRWQYLGEAA